MIFEGRYIPDVMGGCTDWSSDSGLGCDGMMPTGSSQIWSGLICGTDQVGEVLRGVGEGDGDGVWIQVNKWDLALGTDCDRHHQQGSYQQPPSHSHTHLFPDNLKICQNWPCLYGQFPWWPKVASGCINGPFSIAQAHSVFGAISTPHPRPCRKAWLWCSLHDLSPFQKGLLWSIH